MELLIELLGDVLIITLAVFTCNDTQEPITFTLMNKCFSHHAYQWSTPVAHVRRES